MKKLLILVLCICVLGVAAFFVGGKMNRTPEMPFEPEESNQTKSLDVPETESSSPTNRTIETIVSTADLAVIYTDFNSLIADSEIIVVGTVKDLKAYAAVPVQIHTDVVLEIEHVLKGDFKNSTINYTVYGGKMSAIEWYKANSDKIKGKITPELYEKELSNMKSTDEIEAVFMGVENAGIKDKMLLFLVYDDETGSYWIKASSYNGQFFYDVSSDSVFKIIDGEKTMLSTLSEIKTLAETTPDNSAKIREERMNRVPIEKEGEIVERDPAFDKYKE